MSFTLSNELDYSLISLKERKKKVSEIIEKYDEDLIEYYENFQKVNLNQTDRTSEFDYLSKDLEKVADYLLYMDNVEQRKKYQQEKTFNKNMNKKKEYLIDNLVHVEESKREITKNVKIYGKIKVNEKDRKEYKELEETGKLIKSLKGQIQSKKDLKGNDLTSEQIKKMRCYLIDIAKEEVVIKEQLKRYISFKNISRSVPFFDLKLFSFCDKKHIKSLIENYQQLKNNNIDKTENDFKILLFALEDLVEKAIEEPILKKIYDLKIEGEIQERIKDEILTIFNIDISQQRISQIIDEIIPNLILQQYKQEFEDWIFTFIKKGKYKTCSKCKKNLLAINKYFHKDNFFDDGFKKNCKNCRRKK